MIEDQFSFSSFFLFKEHQKLDCSKPIKFFLQYKNYQINLLTGERSSLDLGQFMESLDEYKVNSYFEKPIIVHFFFELGYHCAGLDQLIDESLPLAIFIEYEKVEVTELVSLPLRPKKEIEFLSVPPMHDYIDKYNDVYKHLLDGDCYQVNLTQPIYFRSLKELKPRELMGRLWHMPLKIGAYAHGTYIHALDKLLMSNSPECLFQIVNTDSEYKIKSFPIKGTVRVEDESEREEAWQKLVNSKKDQAELYMITDLVRNDLTKVTGEKSTVVHKKQPLNVPGLVHQFSEVESIIDKNKSIKDIMVGLFPGGSITGAPKKRVLEIIKKVEHYNRGNYCGSTIFLYKNTKTASINIRSIEVDYSADEFKYGAGGGITLMSQAHSEFDELMAKLKSFLKVIL
jgi:anthranilate/para-aminobenzoate synthase component I